MCHNRTNNNKMNCLHERCLRLIYNEKKSSFEDVLQKDQSVSIHHINLRALAVVKGSQRLKSSYFFRSLSFKTTKSIRYEELIIFCYAFCQNSQQWIRKFCSKLWDSIPCHMTEIDSIDEFKHVIEF